MTRTGTTINPFEWLWNLPAGEALLQCKIFSKLCVIFFLAANEGFLRCSSAGKSGYPRHFLSGVMSGLVGGARYFVFSTRTELVAGCVGHL
jgi:hypothetical protein